MTEQSVQEPVSPRLAKGYSPEGCSVAGLSALYLELSASHLYKQCGFLSRGCSELLTAALAGGCYVGVRVEERLGLLRPLAA